MKEAAYNFFLSHNTTIFDILEKIVISALVVVMGFIFKKISKVVINKAIKANKTLPERKMNTMSTICFSFVKYFIYFAVFCQVLTIFGFNITSLLAVAGVGSVAVGFGAKSLVEDLITGLFVLIEDQFGVGDVVTIDGKTGTVESIGIRSTVLRGGDGDVHIVPNGQIKVVTNMSKGFNRAVVEVNIPHSADINSVLRILANEVCDIQNEVSGIIKPPEVLGITSLGESFAVIRIIADCEVGSNWSVEREIRRLVKVRLDRENIPIAYRQTVEIVKDGKYGDDSTNNNLR